jgi:toxin FitB
VSFLLDTNVLSEVRRPEPDVGVMRWLHEVDEDRTFISVISMAEIRKGIRLMPKGRRREALALWLARDLPERFSGRVLPIEERISLQWGDIVADCQKKGIGLSIMDAFLAATAMVHDLRLVTRNMRDFAAIDLETLNPWEAS